MSWLISEVETETGQPDPNVLIAAIKRRWPNAEIKEVSREHVSHEWRIPMPDNGTLEGASFRAGGVTLDDHSDIHYAAEFGVWYRSLVPETIPLQFYDQGYNMHIDLKPETTAAEIVKAVGY